MSGYNRRGLRDPLPEFSIELVLQHLGATDVPAGSGWCRMRCPFHDERTPSAAVNHDSQGFVCHGCGVKGDALALLQRQLGLGFMDALNLAKQITGQETAQQRVVVKRRASDLLRR